MADDMQIDDEPMFQPPPAMPAVDQNPAPANQFLQWQSHPQPELAASDSFSVQAQLPATLSAPQQSAFISSETSPAASQLPITEDMGGLIDKIAAKMHIRRPGRDNWSYIGRVYVFQDLTGKSPSVVVRLQSNNKIVATFTDHSSISVDKRGNFIVVAAVEPVGVISYSLHASDNTEALRILEAIELAAYKLASLTGSENRYQSKVRRRIERTIKEDRRRRHKRRKEDDALVAMLDNATLV